MADRKIIEGRGESFPAFVVHADVPALGDRLDCPSLLGGHRRCFAATDFGDAVPRHTTHRAASTLLQTIHLAVQPMMCLRVQVADLSLELIRLGKKDLIELLR